MHILCFKLRVTLFLFLCLQRILLLYRPPVGSENNLHDLSTQTDPPSTEGVSNSNAASQENHIVEDPPPKYTPPPSYTTATGARCVLSHQGRTYALYPTRESPLMPNTAGLLRSLSPSLSIFASITCRSMGSSENRKNPEEFRQCCRRQKVAASIITLLGKSRGRSRMGQKQLG